jgi:hypothetical protein
MTSVGPQGATAGGVFDVLMINRGGGGRQRRAPVGLDKFRRTGIATHRKSAFEGGKMRRLLLAAGLSATILLHGCATHPTRSGDCSSASPAEDERPRRVQFDWMHDHPVVATAAAAVVLAALVAGWVCAAKD